MPRTPLVEALLAGVEALGWSKCYGESSFFEAEWLLAATGLSKILLAEKEDAEAVALGPADAETEGDYSKQFGFFLFIAIWSSSNWSLDAFSGIFCAFCMNLEADRPFSTR